MAIGPPALARRLLVADPGGRSLPRVRAIRDGIDVRVRGLLAELAPSPA